ncbi:MAG: NAD(P)H-binding protein [Panacagrimonas sp.]
MSRTALIAGATGLVGQQLLNQLLQDTHYDRVRVLSRRPLQSESDKLQVLPGELDQLNRHGEALKADDVFCCLGTTMRKAGSRAAFERVDYHMVLALARAARARGARRFLVISSMGADARSPIYYSRVKGRMENALAEVGFPALHIVRPSLLLGKRPDARIGESLGQRLAPLINPLLRGGYAKYRAIAAAEVAQAMVVLAKRDVEGAYSHTLPLT